MAGSHILSIDQGTTGSTAIIIEPGGKPIASVNREFPNYFPRPGWVEQDANEIWHNVQEVIGLALGATSLSHSDIGAIGIANQRETTILWDRATGEPVTRAIVWQDRRTADFCQQLKEDGKERLFSGRTGLVLDPYFSGTKIRWMLENMDGLRSRAEKGELAFGTVDSWLLWKLTGEHATDFTNASRTLLYNIADHRWDEELLGTLNVPASLLPTVKNCADEFGHTRPEVFGGARCPVLGVAGDQQAALAGNFGFSPGASKNTYGTGSFVVANIGDEFQGAVGGLLTTLAADAEGKPLYAFEGSIFTTGAAVQWLRDEMGLIASARETEALAKGVEDTGGVMMVPSFVGFGSPYWDANARAALLGMTLGTSRAHIVRATLEGIAFQVKDVIEAMRGNSNEEIESLAVDGGGTDNGFLMQFQADILGIPVIKRSIRETTGYGAGLLAGMKAGLMDLSEIQQTVKVLQEFTPSMSQDEVQERYARWKKAVEQARQFGG